MYYNNVPGDYLLQRCVVYFHLVLTTRARGLSVTQTAPHRRHSLSSDTRSPLTTTPTNNHSHALAHDDTVKQPHSLSTICSKLSWHGLRVWFRRCFFSLVFSSPSSFCVRRATINGKQGPCLCARRQGLIEARSHSLRVSVGPRCPSRPALRLPPGTLNRAHHSRLSSQSLCSEATELTRRQLAMQQARRPPSAALAAEAACPTWRICCS